jgi:hypothetical protein
VCRACLEGQSLHAYTTFGIRRKGQIYTGSLNVLTLSDLYDLLIHLVSVCMVLELLIWFLHCIELEKNNNAKLQCLRVTFLIHARIEHHIYCYGHHLPESRWHAFRD